MRTTLDIDDDVLEAAKELALRHRKSAGKIVSDLARKGLVGTPEPDGPGPGGTYLRDGWYVLPRRGGVITKGMVDRLLEDADFEDAGLPPPPR